MNTDDNIVIRRSDFTAVYTLLCFANHETSWCVYSVMLQAKKGLLAPVAKAKVKVGLRFVAM